MRLLLDTHVFLWFITGSDEIPRGVLTALQSPENDVFLSSASVWEAVIKYRLGKLPLPMSPATYLPQQREKHGVLGLPIDEGAMTYLEGLPPLHRDPFDRLIIAQALQHHLLLVTVDRDIRAYSVPLLDWA